MTSRDELWWLLPSFHNLPHNSHNEGERRVEMPDSHLTTPKTLHLSRTKTGLQTPQGLDHSECIVSYPPNFLAPTTQLLFACILCMGSAFCVSMHKASSSVTRLTFPVFNLVLYCSTVLTSFSCVCGWGTHTVVHMEKSKENFAELDLVFSFHLYVYFRLQGYKGHHNLDVTPWSLCL